MNCPHCKMGKLCRVDNNKFPFDSGWHYQCDECDSTFPDDYLEDE